MRRFADCARKLSWFRSSHRRLSSYWVHLITPISSRLAQPLIRGLNNEVIVRDDRARTDFPQIVPIGFDEAVRTALDRYQTGPETAWFDAFDLARVPGDFTGSKRRHAHGRARSRDRSHRRRKSHTFFRRSAVSADGLRQTCFGGFAACSIARSAESACVAAGARRPTSASVMRSISGAWSVPTIALVAIAGGNETSRPRVA